MNPAEYRIEKIIKEELCDIEYGTIFGEKQYVCIKMAVKNRGYKRTVNKKFLLSQWEDIKKQGSYLE